MKKFIDPKGDYLFSIPIEWGCKNGIFDAKKNDPNSFELYENPVGCFQISCNPIYKGEIPKLIKSNALITQKIGANNLTFKEHFVSTDKFDMYLWMAVVKDKFIMCKYIYDSDKRENKKVIEEIGKSKRSLETIIIIEEAHKKKILSSERFDKFMTSYGASLDLTNRAYKNGSSIELVVLLSNQIDALLRLTLILHDQIENETDEIDTTLIFQEENDKPIMEKKVYKMALDNGIIDENLYSKLFDLYSQRNKVIHRYIITDLFTKDVMKFVYEYGILEKKVGEIVKQYEQKQFELKVGIYGTDIPPDKPLDRLGKDKIIGGLKEKHAHNEINKGITFE